MAFSEALLVGTMQLDIFNDSRDVMLRNDVLSAIEARQASSARLALPRLAAEYPQDKAIPLLETLVRALEFPSCRFAESGAALAARNHLETSLQPATALLMAPAQARRWMAREWRLLAEAATGLAFTASAAPAHSAPCWLRAGDWAAAEAAVMTIPSWRRIPLPLSWMAEARLGRKGFEDALPLLAELAWLSPSGFADLSDRLEDPLLARLLREFAAEFENDADADPDLAWFPAWCLIAKPSLAPLLRQTEPGLGRNPERAARLMLDILALEQQGNHQLLLSERKKLRRLHSGLFARYMRTR